MKNILVLSYFYTYTNSKSTAISVNTRIFGIEDYYNIDVLHFENPQGNSTLTSKVKLIEIKQGNRYKLYECVEHYCQKSMEYLRLNQEKYDLVVVHSNFARTNQLIMDIKQNFDIRLISYMPDPFVNGALKEFKQEKVYNHEVEMEYQGYLHSDQVVVTNEFFKDHMLQEYPQFKDKIFVIYHGFIADDMPQKVNNDFLYLGDTYAKRRLDKLLIAFDQLLSENPQYKKYRLGCSISKRKNFMYAVSQLKNPLNFIFYDKIPQAQANQLEREAMGIINVTLTMPDDKQDPYFPTKLAWALKTGKPILTITNNTGCSQAITANAGGYTAKNEIGDIKENLRAIIEEKHTPNLEYIKHFNAQYIGVEFRKIIDN